MSKLKSNPLTEWLSKATIPQREQLIKLAGTTKGSLHQAAKAYRTGGALRITPDLAMRLEKASLKIDVSPHLRREDLSPACSKCDLAKNCRKAMSQD